MIRRDLLFYIAQREGLEFVFNSGRASSYPTHTHVEVFSITAVSRGIVYLKRKASTHVYPAGSVYVVYPHEPHSPAYTDDFSIVSLCVSKNHFVDMSFSSLKSLFMSYARIMIDKRKLLPELASLLLLGIQTIYLAYADWVQNLRISPLLPQQISFMRPEEHGGPPLRMPSQYSFIRRFKKEAGITPHQYILQSRVRKAKKLLARQEPIADVAAQSGFCDQSHMNRLFCKNLGITPRAYRDSCHFIGM